MKSPWTHQELEQLRLRLLEKIDSLESESEAEVKPLPPMTEGEACGLLLAMGRLMPLQQSFLFGQLLAQYRQSVEARMLGKHGRFYVMSEVDIDRMMKESNKEL